MDKKSIFFALSVGVSFYLVQAGFEYWNRSHTPPKAQHNESTTQTVRAASLGEFRFVELYGDPLGREKVATAARVGACWLTLAWKQPLPKQVYVENGTSFDPLQLLSPPNKTSDPVLYGSSLPPSIELPSLPTDRPTDVQLVAIADPLSVQWAQQRGQKLIFEAGEPSSCAIAFTKEKGAYVPIGVYLPSEKKIKLLAEYPKLQELVKQTVVPLSSNPESSEVYYVLENEYQQLVFSTRGGSLAEINLPLKTGKDSPSIVKEVGADRQILAQSPSNARFPLFSHRTIEQGRQVSTTQGKLGGYYPLLRRPILSAEGAVRSTVPPEYYALNIVSDAGDIANASYRVTDFGDRWIRFETSSGDRRIIKTYSIPEERNGPYCFELEIEVQGDAQGLWLSSGVPDAELVGGSYAPQLKYQVRTPSGAEVEEIKLPDEKGRREANVSPYWLSNCNGFLGLIVDPLTEVGQGFKAMRIDGTTLPTRLSLIDAAHQLYPAGKYPGYATLLPLKEGSMKFRVFAGPFDEALLKKLDDLYEDLNTNYNPQYNLAISIQGWFSFISQPFAKFLFFLMQMFYAVSRSWAVSIVLLTIALRAMMYPLNNWSIRSTVKMQEIGPKVKAIQERYKKDPRKAQMEVMNVYREAGINPMSGCLPMLLQMPFLIGMFYMLKSSFPLRGAPFIPGWIDDLAAPDVLFSWGQPVWIIGNEFHLLPILTGAAMLLQAKMTQKTPKDPSQMTDQEKQQKMMGTMMSVLFAFMFYNFPSGLNIYFMFSTLLGVAQQKWMMAKVAPGAAAKG
jgi:YidC/Oxa1 family membrane protein insertase